MVALVLGGTQVLAIENQRQGHREEVNVRGQL